VSTCHGVTGGFEGVSEREPVRDDLELPKPCRVEEVCEVGSVVAAVVSDPLVLRSEAVPALGNAHERPPTGPEMFKPAGKGTQIVLYVFEDLEGTDHVEHLRGRECLGRAVEHASSGTHTPHRGRERDGVGFDAHVVESFGE
jgi:hypothetical protein